MVDTLTFRDTLSLIVLYSIRAIYLHEVYVRGKVNTRMNVRVLLQLFCSTQQKNTIIPHPPSTRRTKQQLMCNGEKRFVAISDIYTYCMRSTHRNPVRSPREPLVQQYDVVSTYNNNNAKCKNNKMLGGGLLE